MPTGSGLDAQVGFKHEVTTGTQVAVTKFIEFDSEDVKWEPTWIEPTGLKVGQYFKRASRLVQSRKSVSGSLEYQHADRTMGTLWRLAVGSSVTTPTQIGLTTAYKQIHTPGGFVNKSMTLQIGRPLPSGTVQAHNYKGVKVTSWEFTCSDNEIAKMKLDLDGWDEETTTALVSATYVSSGVFSFADVTTFTFGGTPTTAAGETTIAGATAFTAIVKGVTIRGENPMDTERFGLGNLGVKKEQLQNDTPTITGSFEAEYDKVQFYDNFKNNTTTALQINFSHGDAGGSNPYLLSFIVPAAKYKTSNPVVAGPDIVRATVDWEAYDDGSGTNPVLQVKLVSQDSTDITA